MLKLLERGGEVDDQMDAEGGGQAPALGQVSDSAGFGADDDQVGVRPVAGVQVPPAGSGALAVASRASLKGALVFQELQDVDLADRQPQVGEAHLVGIGTGDDDLDWAAPPVADTTGGTPG